MKRRVKRSRVNGGDCKAREAEAPRHQGWSSPLVDKYTRPKLKPVDPLTDDVVIQKTDADYATTGGEVTVRFFGCTMSGNSVLIHVHQFMPYFYIDWAWPTPLSTMTSDNQSPSPAAVVGTSTTAERRVNETTCLVEPTAAIETTETREPQDQTTAKETVTQQQAPHEEEFKAKAKILADFKMRLNDAIVEDQLLSNNSRASYDNDDNLDPIAHVEVVSRTNLMLYHPEPQLFLRIETSKPSIVATARRILEQGRVPVRGISTGGGSTASATYESNIPYALRCMIDKDIVGGGWIQVSRGHYTVRQPLDMDSHCQLEIDCHVDDLIAHHPEGEWLKVAPLRILSFDIECQGRKGFFPNPELDPVIQIANVLQIQGQEKPHYQNVFTLNTCNRIAQADEVIENETEPQLLERWQQFLVQVDPDIITGYNIIDFDLPYLLNRATALHIDHNFSYFGRIQRTKSTMKNKTTQSKAHGKRESKEIGIIGRIQFDLIVLIRREYKLRSYTLNAVATHFLKQQKEDVHHSIISDLQNGDAETRHRLAVYCLKDAVLPIRLMQKLMLLINSIEMARVTGVPISYLLSRGQQIKVVSQIHRKAKKRHFVIPTQKSKYDRQEGGSSSHRPSSRGRDDGNYDDDGEEEGRGVAYEGATVIEPKRAYYKDPIATLDFASLYPSIMMAHNLCYTTLLTLKQVATMDPSMYERTPTGDHFLRSSIRGGVLPEILTELLAQRKIAKKAMGEATDPFVVAVLNGRQLALKISANSVYGFTGATVGQLPCLAISSSVTGYGREMILHTKRMVEQHYTMANGYQYDADVVYGDTDSVMVKFGTSDVAEAMRLGAEAADLVSKEFVKPMKLEFEKVYWPFLLMNKKRYAGLYWTKPIKWDKLDAKGIETVRRDNCSLVSDVVEESLNQILMHRNVDSAIAHVKQVVSDLLRNEMDLSKLVITKQLGKLASSKSYLVKQAHVELAERMRKRDPQSAPQLGDRVPYVIIKGLKGARAYEKAEDPLYVLEHDLPIDTTYYLENQLLKPIVRIFEPILGSHAESLLFRGDHSRSIKISTPKPAATSSSSSSSIVRFLTKGRTCAACRAPLSAKERGVCKGCEPRQVECYTNALEKVRTNEQVPFLQYNVSLVMCCPENDEDGRDCPIFYRRTKVKKELTEAQAKLDAFQI